MLNALKNKWSIEPKKNKKSITVNMGAMNLFMARPCGWFNEAQVAAYLARRYGKVCFSSTVGRELRKMREAGQLVSKKAENKTYKVYQLRDSLSA
jgi:hypothetical protein|tara:strand:+ start:249 stop:533 length:285 start_codon:yes stop_codon:yes gene_type:complete